MTYLNKAIFIGKVSQSPLTEGIDSKGRLVVTFTLVVKDAAVDFVSHNTTLITVRCWDELAEFVKKYGKPGIGFLIEGVMLNWRHAGQVQTFLRPTRMSVLKEKEYADSRNRTNKTRKAVDDGLLF